MNSKRVAKEETKYKRKEKKRKEEYEQKNQKGSADEIWGNRSGSQASNGIH
jgi:hypothetical protein